MSMRGRIKTPKQLEAQCAEWNANHPVGTKVEYFAVMHPHRDSRGIYETRSEATILGGHTAVIWLDGKSGCVALEACVPVEGQA